MFLSQIKEGRKLFGEISCTFRESPYTFCMLIVLEIIHIATAALLAFCILLQSRASGLSATFGGSGSTNVVQRRGAEKLIFKVSIWSSAIFFALTILRWYVE